MPLKEQKAKGETPQRDDHPPSTLPCLQTFRGAHWHSGFHEAAWSPNHSTRNHLGVPKTPELSAGPAARRSPLPAWQLGVSGARRASVNYTLPLASRAWGSSTRASEGHRPQGREAHRDTGPPALSALRCVSAVCAASLQKVTENENTWFLQRD